MRVSREREEGNGRKAKEREGREGREGVKADNVVGVACAMTRASSVGNGQLGTVSVSVAYGSESHRGESVCCLPCQTLSFIQGDRAGRGEGKSGDEGLRMS